MIAKLGILLAAASCIRDVQVQQKQASDVGVTDKMSKLSVRDSANEHQADGNSENQTDHPGSKKTKSGSRSRRRRKARRGDAAAAVNGGATCEFVQGGGGKMHSCVGPRRDWFTLDASNKHSPFDNASYSAATNDHCGGDKERQDSVDRKKMPQTPAVEGSSKFDGSSASAVTSQRKYSRDIRSAGKVSDGSPSNGARKSSSASKELSGSKRQGATQRNAASASVSEMQFSKLKTLTESGESSVSSVVNCCTLLVGCHKENPACKKLSD